VNVPSDGGVDVELAVDEFSTAGVDWAGLEFVLLLDGKGCVAVLATTAELEFPDVIVECEDPDEDAGALGTT
jgi:hypothetical protein